MEGKICSRTFLHRLLEIQFFIINLNTHRATSKNNISYNKYSKIYNICYYRIIQFQRKHIWINYIFCSIRVDHGMEIVDCSAKHSIPIYFMCIKFYSLSKSKYLFPHKVRWILSCFHESNIITSYHKMTLTVLSNLTFNY